MRSVYGILQHFPWSASRSSAPRRPAITQLKVALAIKTPHHFS